MRNGMKTIDELAIETTKEMDALGRVRHTDEWISEFLYRAVAKVQEQSQPVAWIFTGEAGFKKYLTQTQYEAQTEAVKKWYEPFKCTNCCTITKPDTEELEALRGAYDKALEALNASVMLNNDMAKLLANVHVQEQCETFGYWDKREQRFVNLETCGRCYDQQEIDELLVPLFTHPPKPDTGYDWDLLKATQESLREHMKTITCYRTVMEQAMEALEFFQKRESMDDLESFGYKVDGLLTDLREVLKEK